MEADTQAHVAFFLTGRRTDAEPEPVEGLGLRPALLAGYRDLAALRYDFPLVLTARGGELERVQSLSAIFDEALTRVCTGAGAADAAALRHLGLRLEREIRGLVVGGFRGLLSAAWSAAAAAMESKGEAGPADRLRRLRAAVTVEGELADCDEALPARLVRHAWAAVQSRKAASFQRRLERLVLRLGEILEADFERSEAGRSAARLKASVGGGFAGAFDFDSLSRTLATARPRVAFSESRRRRISDLLATLRSQRFFSAPKSGGADSGVAEKPFEFQFASCGEALASLRGRMPALVALARAIVVAELEIEGLYSEARHDGLFRGFGDNGLDPQDLAAFPDYLVCVNASCLHGDEHAQLLEVLSSGLPIKVLLQIDDILEESPYGEGNLTTGTRSRQVASMAMGLNEVYVLQAPASHLYRFREPILRGLRLAGPALFSVYSGASGATSDLPPYVLAAAALESRAFPAFAYDPSAGPNWASRFTLEANPRLELDWPVQPLVYEDEQHQRVTVDLAFTLVDFVACDRRYARHLARVPRAKWNSHLIPVDEALSRERKGLPDSVPCLWMVDERDVLQRVLADERLLREARRCREMWHSLQELAGVHNSHAEALLARERRAWEARAQQELPAAVPIVTVASAPAPASSSARGVAPAAEANAGPERSPDESYIETQRCSTCNECTNINNKMFAYDSNKQAYIADLDAGTYAQLVEAAESCQVAAIHPGKPRNPREPDLDALQKRAAAFR
ncbi:MAG: hypothetical protein IPK67_14815 [Planctomycetes bacterium]|nr:hypothetical protein [Planctomycetota bacterium]